MGDRPGPLSAVHTHQLLIAVAVGAVVGLASGAFGKGGSALATPLLAAFGIPPIVAVASPLPATIPATAIAGRAYARAGKFDWRVVRIGIVVGLPLTAAGALLTRWVPGEPLVLGSELLVLALALRMLLRPQTNEAPATESMNAPPLPRVVATVAAVAFVSGLLANSGGFLLAPLFVAVLHMPLKRATRYLARHLTRIGDPRHDRPCRARSHRMAPDDRVRTRVGSLRAARRAHQPACERARAGAQLRHRPRPRIDASRSSPRTERTSDGRAPSF